MSYTPAARPLLWPLVPVYRLAVALRELGLRLGLQPVRRLRWPVLSIGSLSAGGAGKTPLAIALAQALAARGLRVDVLSRGYGRKSRATARVDPNGAAAGFGDEPLLIAREAGVPVYVAARRYQAGLMAEAAEPASAESAVHLLDDGFQHRRLARDVDILLLSRGDLDDHLLPAGNLREPLRSVRRAGVIAIPADDRDLEAEVRRLGWQGQLWRLRRTMQVPPISGPVAAFCGIARPNQFFSGLESAGLHVASRIAFPDHHRYDAHDLACLLAAAHSVRATALLTTEKDRVRLGDLAASIPASLPLTSVLLRVAIENEAAAVDWLIERLALGRLTKRGTLC